MPGARSMIHTARSYLGQQHGPAGCDRPPHPPGRAAAPRCAAFVGAVARESGNAALFPDGTGWAAARHWFADRGRLSGHPAVGAQVFFLGPGSPYEPAGEHTGVCIAYTRTTVTVIAGDPGGGDPGGGGPGGGPGGVHRRVHRRSSPYVDSFGYPAYAEGLVCADPGWRGRHGVLHLGPRASEADLPPEPAPGARHDGPHHRRGHPAHRDPLQNGRVSDDVRALYRALLDGWNMRDAAYFAACFAEDGGMVGFDGSTVDGRRAIGEHLAAVFAGHRTAAYVGKVEQTRPLGAGTVLLRAVAGMVPPDASDLNPALNAVQTLVARRTAAGAWLIEHFQTTPAAFHGRPEETERLTRELREVMRGRG